MKSILSILFLLCSFCAFADSSPIPSPAPSGIAGIAAGVQGSDSLDFNTFIADTLAIAGQIKGSVPLGIKIAGLVLLLIALTKVSFLNAFWKKLGNFQAFVAPLLGLILGLCLYGVSGPLTAATLFAYLASGAGAIAVHELLDAIKTIPGLGAVYVAIINGVESILGGGAAASK